MNLPICLVTLDPSFKQTSHLSLTGEFFKNLKWIQSSDKVRVPCFDNPDEIFPWACLVNWAVFFFETTDSAISGRSRARETIDQILVWIGRCSCSRSPLAINVTLCYRFS